MSTDRKAPKMRGLRDVATVQTQIVRSAPTNRIQAVSRFARLENERMRILRELDAWNARKCEAERMLAKVEEELAAMQALLLETQPTPARPAAAPKRRAAARAGEAPPSLLHPHVTIEY